MARTTARRTQSRQKSRRRKLLPVPLAVEYAPFDIEPRRLRRAIRDVAAGEKIPCGQISVAIVTGAAMRKLNRQFLQHDYDTDVLTFCLDSDCHHDDEHEHGDECHHAPEGEIVVSADFARRMAPRYDWRPADELLLYVIHGVLHLAGYNDAAPRDRAAMRDREAHYLRRFGLQHNHGEPVPPNRSRPAAARRGRS